ncbi:Helix-turn-helix [Nakamurella panacisegetis]|uniref:Helix-turn-helix n=1 Tax=Nakamurella panacisegetis TaxID=1090615 RepID=A0A1H0T4M6_9ACTN|nr:XRE family transcriptional regulator [Nakamurella panacisegetis]SDP48919.1 Helix-turn-helix [Nakamurella panacisegetis]
MSQAPRLAPRAGATAAPTGGPPALAVPVIVGRRITEFRQQAGLSLSELARRANLGKGTLSELEAGRRNPTLETLYALTAPLGVGLASLIDLGAPAVGLRGAVSGDAVTAVLLDVIGEIGVGATTEVYRLIIASGGRRLSPAHGSGVREQLTIVSGVAEVGRIGQAQRVGAGETVTWLSDVEHTFAALGTEPAVGVLVITNPAPTRGGSRR